MSAVVAVPMAMYNDSHVQRSESGSALFGYDGAVPHLGVTNLY